MYPRNGALRLSDKDVNELRGLAERLTKGHESLAVARRHLFVGNVELNFMMTRPMQSG